MKILITNDDGYQARGIAALASIMRKYGDVTVVAPKGPQSGMSMAVKLGFRPLAAKKLSDTEGERWWYLDGPPASCIKFGIDNIFWPEKPDLVVSGINHGSNAATAAIYSGTIGGAMEGAVNRIPAIAVSLDSFDGNADFSAVEKLLPGVLDRLLANMEWKRGLLYNINFPNLPADSIKGLKVCRMGMVHWEREYRPYPDYLSECGMKPDKEGLRYMAEAEDGEEIYVMAGDFVDDGNDSRYADHLLLDEGYVTLTPHNIDNTDLEEFERLCAII